MVTLASPLTWIFLFQDARSRALSNGTKVTYASIDRLLDLKANTGWPKDASDVAILTETALGRRARQSVDLADMGSDTAGGGGDQGGWPADPPVTG